MDGLIIKHKWLDLILKGQKTIEVRGSDTKKQPKKMQELGQLLFIIL